MFVCMHAAMSRILLRTVLVILLISSMYGDPKSPSTTDRAQPDEETRGVDSTPSAAAAGSSRDSALPELGLGPNPILNAFLAKHVCTSALCYEYLMRYRGASCRGDRSQKECGRCGESHLLSRHSNRLQPSGSANPERA